MRLRDRGHKLLANARLDHASPAVALLGVWYAVGLHMLWAGLLLFTPSLSGSTAVYPLSQLFPNPYGLSIILVTVAGCASYGLFKQGPGVTDRVLLLVPQQLVLGVSAAGALHAMALGTYADGTVRSSAFIIADQAPAVLALFVHSASIVLLALVRPWR